MSGEGGAGGAAAAEHQGETTGEAIAGGHGIKAADSNLLRHRMRTRWDLFLREIRRRIDLAPGDGQMLMFPVSLDFLSKNAFSKTLSTNT